MQKLPIITKRHDVEIKSIGGQSIFNYYKQIQKIINAEYPNEKINEFISEPVLSDAQDEIHWYTFLNGEIKPFSTLEQNEKVDILNQLKLFQTKIDNLILKISKVDGETSSGPQALKYLFVCPNIEESLFSINGRVQISQWGCVPFGKNPSDYNLVLSIEHNIKRNSQDSFANIKPNSLNTPPNLTEQITNTPEFDGGGPQIEHEKKFDERSMPPTPGDEISDHPVDNEKSNFPWRTLILLFLLLILLLLFFYTLYDFFRVTRFHNLEASISELTSKLHSKIDACSTTICSAPGSGGINTPSDGPVTVTTPDPGVRREQVGVVAGKQLNISLIWEAPVDLDLLVKEPNGNVVSFLQPLSSTGGKLDIDQNRGQIVTHPIENISYDQMSLPGNYEVNVLLYNYHNFPENRAIDFDVEISEGRNKRVVHRTFSPNSRFVTMVVETVRK